jgi:hypothetical protein
VWKPTFAPMLNWKRLAEDPGGELEARPDPAAQNLANRSK